MNIIPADRTNIMQAATIHGELLYHSAGNYSFIPCGGACDGSQINSEGEKKNESLPYLPHNDRDVFQLSAQLIIINRFDLYSIHAVNTKIKTEQKLW